MVKIKDVTKTYKAGEQIIKAVDNVNLECRRGEYISIVGHSGSGKTTLLSLIGGITKPDSGTIVIDGTELGSLNDSELSEIRNKKMSFIFQFSSIIPTLTALENVMMPTVFSKIKVKTEKDAVMLLEMTGLRDKIYSYPSQLSGGQQKRVAIARAFINDPEIILADEPTGDIDEETEAEILRFFKKLNNENGSTFLLVTHNLSIASQAKRMLKMSNGKLEGVQV